MSWCRTPCFPHLPGRDASAQEAEPTIGTGGTVLDMVRKVVLFTSGSHRVIFLLEQGLSIRHAGVSLHIIFEAGEAV